MHYDNNLTSTEARQDTYATDIKDNINIANDLQIDRAADNKINGRLTGLPEKNKTAKQTQGR